MRWILSLAAIGAFIGFIVYLNTLPDGSSRGDRPAPPATTGQPPARDGQAAQPEPATRPEFRFYDMLPDSEVVPPTVDEYRPSPARQNIRYMVQTGSFRSETDAERQRAQIAFQGLRATIQRTELDSGSVWYRVHVGPFDSRSQMNSAVDKLVAINIQPLVRQIPKED